MKKNLVLLLLLGALAACSPVSAPAPTALPSPTALPALPQEARNPYAPQEADYLLDRAEVFITSADLVLRHGDGAQVALALTGSLPTPCHQLRVRIPPPAANGDVLVEVYSVYKSGQACTQVLKNFSATIELGIYPPGQYQLYINGQYLGNFAY